MPHIGYCLAPRLEPVVSHPVTEFMAVDFLFGTFDRHAQGKREPEPHHELRSRLQFFAASSCAPSDMPFTRSAIWASLSRTVADLARKTSTSSMVKRRLPSSSTNVSASKGASNFPTKEVSAPSWAARKSSPFCASHGADADVPAPFLDLDHFGISVLCAENCLSVKKRYAHVMSPVTRVSTEPFSTASMPPVIGVDLTSTEKVAASPFGRVSFSCVTLPALRAASRAI